MVRDIPQDVWFSAHCLVTHLLFHKVIRNIPQHVWIFSRCSITHLLHLKKMISDLIYPIFHKSKSPQFYLCLRLGEVRIYPETVIFVSDSHKTDYLIPTTTLYFHCFFSSSGSHQSITRSRCHAIGKSFSLIFAFWALCF